MNILLTCFSRSWGGLELQALEHARMLQTRGHAVWLACMPDSRLEREANEAHVAALPFDVTGYLHPRLIWRLGKFIARNNVDLIHCLLSKDIATVVPATRVGRDDIPIVLTRGMGSAISKKDPFHQYTYGHVTRVLAVSSVIHKNVLATTPMPPDKVVTFPVGVDTALFSPTRVDRQVVRREFGFGANTTVVGFVGRFTPGKGLEELLHAAALLRPAWPEVRFLVAGEASYGEEDYAQSIHDLHRSLGLVDSVRFAGFRRDVPEVMAAFDIFAFPSHAEAFGVVLIEAMALERPVVATNCDGVVDIVVDGETGIQVPPRDAQALADGLAVLLKDPALRARMGAAGRSRVMERFDQHRLLQQLEDLYQSLIDGN